MTEYKGKIKLIIEISQEDFDEAKMLLIEGVSNNIEYAVANGKPYEETTSGDLISRNALKEQTIEKRGLSWEEMQNILCISGEELDNAPTVFFDWEKSDAYLDCIRRIKSLEKENEELRQFLTKHFEKRQGKEERPKGEIFPMEIVAGKCPIDANGDCPLKPKGEWIPVSERLPNCNGCYNVTRKLKEGETIYFISDVCYFDGQNTWHRDTGVNHGRPYLNDIIAWQPLPEPYKKEGEEE